MLEPLGLQLEFWVRSLQHDPEYGKNAWKTLNVSTTLRKWTQHPTASVYCAPEPDAGLEPLVFDDKIQLEAHLVTLMKLVGGMGAVATRVLALFDAKAQDLGKVVAQYRDPSISVENPREEAASILESIRKTLVSPWAKDLTDLSKFAGAAFNKMLLMRRCVN